MESNIEECIRTGCGCEVAKGGFSFSLQARNIPDGPFKRPKDMPRFKDCPNMSRKEWRLQRDAREHEHAVYNKNRLAWAAENQIVVKLLKIKRIVDQL